MTENLLVAKRKRKSLADELRAAIDDSGLTQYRIAKDTGISQPVINRFVNREREVSLETADKLLRYLGIELRRGKRR